MTALITTSFMIRNTSPVGWVPLLAIKVLAEGAFPPLLIALFTVAFPILFGLVWIDTRFYGADEWVFTSYNFLEMNVIHGLSKYFGVDDYMYYLKPGFINIFLIMFVPGALGLFYHCRIHSGDHFNHKFAIGDYPYTALYVIFYVCKPSLVNASILFCSCVHVYPAQGDSLPHAVHPVRIYLHG